MLIRPISSIKEYVRLNITTNAADLKPSILRAENKFIKKYLGQDQYQVMVSANNSNILTAEQTELLHYISGCLYNYACYLSLPALNVQIGSSGITQQHTDNSKPAFGHAVKAVEQSLKDAAYEWLEEMLNYLEANEDDFPIWQASTAYTMNKECFINTASVFDEIYKIDCQRQTFQYIKPIMKDMECLTILPTIGQAYFDELKSEIENKSITANNKTPIELIQKAVANYTIANAIQANWVSLREGKVVFAEMATHEGLKETTGTPSMLSVKINHAKETANLYLDKLRDHLAKNIDNYPSYSAYLSTYEATEINCESSEEEYNPRSCKSNDKTSGIYVF